jgi:hypothetical protein
MSDNENKRKPWGFAAAPIEREVNGQKQTNWVDIGAVWQAESGALSITLDVEPVAWRDIRVRRVLVITPAKKDEAPPAAKGKK